MGPLISFLEKITPKFTDEIEKKIEYTTVDYVKDGYRGECINGKGFGQCTIHYSNGEKFIGEFKNGFSSGKGILYRIDGMRLEGTFECLKMKGKGFIYDKNDIPFQLYDGKQTIMLLGCGQCGKTTFYKRYIMYQGKDFTVEKDMLKGQMISNFLNILIFIGTELSRLKGQELTKILNFSELRILYDFLQNSHFTCSNALNYYTQENYSLFLKIYQDPIYKKIMNENILLFSELETCFRIDPWLNEYPPLSLRDKRVSDLDFLRVYMKTIGLNTYTFDNRGYNVEITDTGGQRNERKKWKSFHHLVNEGSTVYYFVSLIEFAQELYEGKDYYGLDEKTRNPQGNRMVESLNVFEDVINERPYNNLDIHLVFTKKDLFPKIFTLFFDYFDMVFPNECRNEGIRYNQHERGLDIIKGAFLARNKNPNRKIKTFDVNLMNSNDFGTILGTDCNPIQGEHEKNEKEFTYFNEEFWNPGILFQIQQAHFSYLLYLRFCLNRRMTNVNIYFF